jgi:hypothetical protein
MADQVQNLKEKLNKQKQYKYAIRVELLTGEQCLEEQRRIIPHSAGNLRQKIILLTRCTKELQNQFLSVCELNRRFNPINKY